MSLHDLFPLQYVKDKFDKEVVVEEYNLSTIKELSRKEPDPVLEIGLCIWHQIVTRKLFQVDPRAMAKYVDDRDPILYKKIEEFLCIQAIFDLYYANLRIRDESLKKNNKCCQICFAHTYPNDIVLSDVTFKNPYKPIPKEKQRYCYARYEGLALLPVLMQRLKKYSLETNKDRILLTVAAGDLIPLFSKYGFKVDGSLIPQTALKAGFGIPMQLLLK
jgi:hypothetical protein